MLNCYHIPIYHNRAVPCRVAWLLQPCWLGTVRHGFDRVYTSNFNRTVPCRAISYRAGTEKLCRVNGVLQPNLSKYAIFMNTLLCRGGYSFGVPRDCGCVHVWSAVPRDCGCVDVWMVGVQLCGVHRDCGCVHVWSA